MNPLQTISLKMGNKYIFREPLQNLTTQRTTNYMNTNFQKNNYYSAHPNNYNMNSRNNPKRGYQDMDVIPKFIANENMKELNKELLDRIQNKKATFTKILKTYFSEKVDNFSNSIQEIEMDINSQKLSFESIKNKDYNGFKDLISFINDNRTNPKITSMKNMSLDEYKALSNEEKNTILGGIYQNKALFNQKLNLNNVNINKNIDENPYSKGFQRQRSKTENRINNNPKKNIVVTQDQIELFQIFIGNSNISNNEILSYFDSNNNKVIVAAEKYFKKKYGCEYLTLQYYYPYQPKLGIKVHKFRFVSEISNLFMAAHNDYLSLNNSRLYLENGREIKDDKKMKCIGSLGLQNNSKIKVII